MQHPPSSLSFAHWRTTRDTKGQDYSEKPHLCTMPRTLLTTLNAKYIHTNLAIRLLYQLNKERGDVWWHEFTIKENQDEVAAHCADYEVVAFSCYIWNITQTLAVAAKIKALKPEVAILLGGPEVSYDWQNVIDKPQVDFIITGEGETPFREFLECWPDVSQMANLVWKEQGEVRYLPKAEQFDLKNYEGIMPYADDKPEELKTKVLYIETSRGCPYKCEFCLASLDNKVRYLPDTHIKSTLLHMMRNGRVVKFLDRTFNIKRDFTISTFEFILANYQPGNVFQFEITADILHPDIVRFIDERVPVGLFRFEIGIQTVNQKANLEVSRKQNFDKTVGIIQSLRHKVEMHLDLIVGLPHDYLEDIKYSFEEVFKLYPPELQLGFLKFLKGTPMLHKHAQHDYLFDPEPPYQIIQSKYLSVAELHAITLVEHVLEIYWNKPRAPLTLRYITEQYSVFDFMQGLGVWWAEHHEILHKYTLQDVYQYAWDYVQHAFPTDKVLHEMIALDYYQYHKIKPKVQFLEEVNKSEKYLLLEQLGQNHAKYRFVVLSLSFDYQHFARTNEVLRGNEIFILRYDGVSAAQRINTKTDSVLEH
jgi:anaerobic magnesium-protoporphyrin IX monomethyl ester cyclase